MNRFYISVASNIEPEINIQAAVSRLREFARIISVSRCFVNDAIPSPDDEPGTCYPYYVNCVVLLESTYDAKNFKHSVLQHLETALGRVRTKNKFASRTIDLDILLYNDEVVSEEGIEVPDPDILDRWFLLLGILDIDPKATLPTTSKPLSEYLDCLDAEEVSKSDRLRVNSRLRACLMSENLCLNSPDNLNTL
jgi:2-amino-4-hydroxy-6-hydroxymethyldihydropteridine diphosphokinase